MLDTTDIEGTLFDLRCWSTFSFLIHDVAIQGHAFAGNSLQTLEPGVPYPSLQIRVIEIVIRGLHVDCSKIRLRLENRNLDSTSEQKLSCRTNKLVQCGFNEHHY